MVLLRDWHGRFQRGSSDIDGGRFLKQDEAARERRRKRTEKRAWRAKNSQTEPRRRRSKKDRHKRYPCCGKRRGKCRCFRPGGQHRHVARACRRSNLQALKKKLKMVTLLNKNDTVDIPPLMEKYGAHMKKDIVWAFMWCIMCRLYNKQETLATFEEFLVFPPKAKQPNWKGLEKALESVYRKQRKGCSAHGGLYRHPKLRKYRMKKTEEWQKVNLKRMSRAKRDVVTMKLLWQALPQPELRKYGRQPTSITWAAFYDAFRSAVSETIAGAYDDYMMKVTLDPLIAVGVVKDSHLSRWPTGCPGYQAFLEQTYPNIDKSDYLACMQHIHWELSHLHNFNFCDTMAQLCWDHRRQSGSLHDST